MDDKSCRRVTTLSNVSAWNGSFYFLGGSFFFCGVLYVNRDWNGHLPHKHNFFSLSTSLPPERKRVFLRGENYFCGWLPLSTFYFSSSTTTTTTKCFQPEEK